MERLTARKNEKREEHWFECPAVKEFEDYMIYDRLAELEDKLEAGELVEINPISFPTWEQVKDIPARVLCSYKDWHVTRVGDEIYSDNTTTGALAKFANSVLGYTEACAWVIEQRKELIKELCGE